MNDSDAVDFIKWLEGFEGSDDGVGIFADWVFSKKAKVSRAEEMKGIADIKSWLVKKKASKTVRRCFLTAWRSYQQWLGEMEVSGQPLAASVKGHTYPVVMTVTRHFENKLNRTEEKDEKREFIDVRRFLTTPAKVSVKLGLTVGIGDYEHARIDAGVEVPCYTEEVDDAYLAASKWAETRIRHEVDKVRRQEDVTPQQPLSLVPVKTEEKSDNDSGEPLI